MHLSNIVYTYIYIYMCECIIQIMNSEYREALLRSVWASWRPVALPAELPTKTSKRNAGRVCLIEKRDIRCPMHML